MSGQVDFKFDNLAAAAANIRSGKLKALAVTTVERSSAMPEVPTVAEAGAAHGLRQFDVPTWFGIFAPARLPGEVAQSLNRAFVDALAQRARPSTWSSSCSAIADGNTSRRSSVTRMRSVRSATL